MSVPELQARTEQKLKSISANSAIAALTQFLTVRPVGSKNRDLIRRDLEMFQNIVGKLQEGEYEGLMKSLKEQQCEVLIDYLHRFMQFVGETQNQAITSGFMLRLYERVIKEYGSSIIIKANLRNDTLVNRICNY